MGRKAQKGFTLFELMFVIAISLFIIVGGAVSYNNYRRLQSTKVAAHEFMQSINNAVAEAKKSEKYTYILFKTMDDGNLGYEIYLTDSTSTNPASSGTLRKRQKIYSKFSGTKIIGSIDNSSKLVFNQSGEVDTTETSGVDFTTTSNVGNTYTVTFIASNNKTMYMVNIRDSGRIDTVEYLH